MSQSKLTTTMLIPDDGLADRLAQKVPELIRLYPWSHGLVPDLISVKKPISLGRDESCDVVLDDDGVSRKHAELRPVGVSVQVTDLGSRNGCQIGPRRVDGEGRADPGDMVTFGRCVFLVVKAIGRYDGWWSIGTRGPILGGPRMGEIRQLVRQFSSMKNPVLITGESGTGKEVIANELHRMSGRSGPLVAVNCAAIPDKLFEDHFFGHRRGAFSDAKQTEPGFFQSAEGGTLFLDEIGELEPSVQPKLLRVLETQQVLRVGAIKPEPTDVRVLVATNRDMSRAVADGIFRADLYSRLHVLTVPLPPLRDRPEDIVILSQHFLSDLEIRDLSPAAVQALVRYCWPLNARELRNVLIEAATHALARGENQINVNHLRPEIIQSTPTSLEVKEEHDGRTSAVLAAMKRHKGNVAHAADELSLHRAQIYKVLRQVGSKADDFR